MNYTDYKDARNALIRQYSTRLMVKQDLKSAMQFNMVSASLLNFLPGIAYTEHENIYRNILLHKKLSILEQDCYFLPDVVKMENLTGEIRRLLQTQPNIVCTFHLGSYRLINLFLIREKIPFTLVMGEAVIEKEGKHFRSIYQQLTGGREQPDLPLINAEAASSGIQMLRELKKGRTLVIYIDGNTGAGKATLDNENGCVIDFLQQQVMARKGIAFLAHAARVPLLTVACYRKAWDDIRLRFFDPLYPNANAARDVYAQEATQYIFDQVALLIAEHPEQWEGWLYLHKTALIQQPVIAKSKPPFIRGKPLCFNHGLFGIFKVNDIPYLLKKSEYHFYEIDRHLYDQLIMAHNQSVVTDCFEVEVFEELFEQRVLVHEQ